MHIVETVSKRQACGRVFPMAVYDILGPVLLGDALSAPMMLC